jgi:hypothetical protein
LFIDDVEIKDGGLDSAPLVQSDIEGEIEIGDTTPHPPSPQQPSSRSYSYDAHFLPHDSGERIPISSYDVNIQDDVCRG